MANMMPAGLALLPSLSFAKSVDYIPKANPQDLVLYLATSFFAWMKLQGLAINTSRISKSKFIFCLYWLTGPIRTYQLIRTQTSPFSSLKTHSCRNNCCCLCQIQRQTLTLSPTPLWGNKYPSWWEFCVWMCSAQTQEPPILIPVAQQGHPALCPLPHTAICLPWVFIYCQWDPVDVCCAFCTTYRDSTSTRTL